MELRNVEHVHLAHAMKREVLAAILVLSVLRLIASAVLPLSADEAYYWLWSRHLAAGYFDHPPGIAYVIRAGTVLFGDTPFGVRVGGVVLSFAASWFVWRAGALLLRDGKSAGLACLFFNLALMVAVETMAATPDAPSVTAAAAFVWGLAKVADSGDGRWWLAAGFAAGLALLAKYTALFLGLGALVWLIFAPQMRRWLASPWPYLGGLIAAALFAPNLWWNATHHWETFAFQFGRIEGGRFTLRYLGEFLGAQLLLASPFVLVLAALGLSRATRDRDARVFLPAAILWPSVAYFTEHSLHDRVQGNWPCFLYPVLAIAAADAARRADGSGWRDSVAGVCRKAAIPVAALLLLFAYAQAIFGVVSLGRGDPLARLLAVGFPQVVKSVETLGSADQVQAILTTDYATTAWFAFYSSTPVIEVGEDFRWPDRPVPALPSRPLLYVAETKRDRPDTIARHFAQVTLLAHVDRMRGKIPVGRYAVYLVRGPKGPVGRLVTGP